MPSFSGGGNMPLELSRHSSSPNILSSSSMRQSSGSFTPQSPATSNAHHSNNYSPIFLQTFLVDFLDGVLSSRFGNFLCKNENERERAGVFETSECLWVYLADMRASEGSSHTHYNIFYDPSRHDGPLLPPAAALAPTLWPQFHLRWSCPSEAQSSQVEAQCRNMMEKYTELQKAKDLAENNAREIMTTVESLTADLLIEGQASNSAVALARKANMENSSIKRAIGSLGCIVHVSETDNIAEHSAVKVDMSSPTREPGDSGDTYEEATDLCVSIVVTADNSDSSGNLTDNICESLCPLRAPDGGCRWPIADCGRIRNEFIGVKANFDAFDRLSIHDSYFLPE